MRFSLKGLIKILIGLILIYFLFSKFNIHSLLNTIKNARVDYIAMGILFFLILFFVQAWRLFVLIVTSGIGYLTTLKITAIGFFINNLLPSNIGGDAYKVYFLKKNGVRYSKGVSLIFIDRMSALIVIFVCGLFSVFLNLETIAQLVENQKISLRFGGIVFWSGITATLLLFSLILIFRKKIARFMIKLRQFFADILISWASLSFSRYLRVLWLSLLAFIVRVLRFYFIIRAFHSVIEIEYLVIVVFTVNVISVIPISFGNLGIQEGVIIAGLSFFGIPPIIAASVAIINRFFAWFIAFIGGLVFLSQKQNRPLNSYWEYRTNDEDSL